MEEKSDLPIVNVLDTGNLPEEKSRPNRSMLVAFFFLLGCVGTWVYLNAAWIRPRLFPSGKPLESR